MLSRRSIASWLPWAGVLILIVWNEAVDLWVERWPVRGQQYAESVKDVLLTLAVPTVLLTLLRLRPELFVPASRRRRR